MKTYVQNRTDPATGAVSRAVIVKTEPGEPRPNPLDLAVDRAIENDLIPTVDPVDPTLRRFWVASGRVHGNGQRAAVYLVDLNGTIACSCTFGQIARVKGVASACQHVGAVYGWLLLQQVDPEAPEAAPVFDPHMIGLRVAASLVDARPYV